MVGDVHSTAGGVVAEPVHVRRLTDQEGQKLQQVVRRGSARSVRYRRAMMLLASAGGNRGPVIAQLVQADGDTVRDVIHPDVLAARRKERIRIRIRSERGIRWGGRRSRPRGLTALYAHRLGPIEGSKGHS